MCSTNQPQTTRKAGDEGHPHSPGCTLGLLAVLILTAGVALAQSGDFYDLTWNTVDSVFSSGGEYTLAAPPAGECRGTLQPLTFTLGWARALPLPPPALFCSRRPPFRRATPFVPAEAPATHPIRRSICLILESEYNCPPIGTRPQGFVTVTHLHPAATCVAIPASCGRAWKCAVA